MSSDKSQKIRLIYEWLTAALLFLTAAALIVGCVSIYLSGEKPFSRDAVASVFSRIDLLVYATLIFVVGGFIIALFVDLPKKKAAKRTKNQSVLSSGAPSDRDRVITAVIFALGAILLVLGLILGGAADVLAKAVNICTECIGLG